MNRAFHREPSTQRTAGLSDGRQAASRQRGRRVRRRRANDARRYPEVRIKLLGTFDSNPAAITRAEVESWVTQGTIEYPGETKEVRPYLANCSVFCCRLSRRYARTILEAMATGAIVTTDGPGCAEPVEDGVTGLVVPVRNAAALAAAMEKFVTNPAMIQDMGVQARRRVEEYYDVHAVNRTLFGGMQLAGAGSMEVDFSKPKTSRN